MSAFPQKADVVQHEGHVRFVPIADSCSAANRIYLDGVLSAPGGRRPSVDARHGKCPSVACAMSQPMIFALCSIEPSRLVAGGAAGSGSAE
jgi:hypothetical protein